MRKEVNYLGHVITDKGVKPDPQKIKCVLKFPIPTNAKEVKSFLGLSGYYRRFIQNYGYLAKPLTTLLKKDVTFIWSDLCQEAFENLKSKLTQAPLLQYPDFNQKFNLICDASNYAIGCILSQGPLGNYPPIAYASRTLNKAEQNYNTTEKELCAIVWGVKQFRPYLLGQKFNVITDHRALTWLFNINDPGSRLTRWRLKLYEYEYDIYYKPGINNTNADALSRIHVTSRAQAEKENSKDSKKTEELSSSKSYTDHPESQLPYTSKTLNEENLIRPSYEVNCRDKDKGLISTAKVQEVNGNLFEVKEDVSLAHCVSKDFKMPKGIALKFRRKFGKIDELQMQQKNVTEIAYLKLENRFIFYFIVKENHWQKPTYENFFKTIVELRKICEEKHLSKVAIPKIGCGLDQMNWTQVKTMINYVFKNSNVNIIAFSKDNLTVEEKQKIISEHHDLPLAGHQGVKRTLNRIQETYRWTGMKQQMSNYIKRCPTCQLSKTSNKNVKVPMVITTTSNTPFEKIFMDIVGSLPRTNGNNSFIITLQDDLTKFSWAIPAENYESNTVAYHFVTQFICLHGIPNSVVTDCGTEFLSKVFTEVCRLLKIKKSSTSPYHPQSNGSLERSHRTLGEYLRNVVSKDQLNWDTYIPFAMFAYNSSVHSATGYQPYELVYGRKVELLTTMSKPADPQYNFNDYQFEIKRKLQETYEVTKNKLIANKNKSKERYDNKSQANMLKIRDKVYMETKATRNKLTSKWSGPFEILEILPNGVNVAIKPNSKRQVIDRNLLKLHY